MRWQRKSWDTFKPRLNRPSLCPLGAKRIRRGSQTLRLLSLVLSLDIPMVWVMRIPMVGTMPPGVALPEEEASSVPLDPTRSNDLHNALLETRRSSPQTAENSTCDTVSVSELKMLWQWKDANRSFIVLSETLEPWEQHIAFSVNAEPFSPIPTHSNTTRSAPREPLDRRTRLGTPADLERQQTCQSPRMRSRCRVEIGGGGFLGGGRSKARLDR
jgi:hypothetical protein